MKLVIKNKLFTFFKIDRYRDWCAVFQNHVNRRLNEILYAISGRTFNILNKYHN